MQTVELDFLCLNHHQTQSNSTRDSIIFSCGCTLPLVDGVIRCPGLEGYSDSFGLQWQTWQTTQLDSHTGTTISRDRLYSALGKPLFEALAGLKVLEVGCGAGRFTEVLLEAGSAVASVDISSAIHANALNFPPSPEHTLIQADATRLPLQPRQFDLVIALGMVQHTPTPMRTVSALAQMVKPGGQLVLDHYAWGLRHLLQVKPIYRQIMKRLKPNTALQTSNRLYDAWAPLHRKFTNRRSRLILTRVSPIVYFTSEYPQLSAADREAWGRLDTHDSLTDWYKHRMKKKDFLKLVGGDRQSVVVEAGVNGWVARIECS